MVSDAKLLKLVTLLVVEQLSTQIVLLIQVVEVVSDGVSKLELLDGCDDNSALRGLRWRVEQQFSRVGIAAAVVIEARELDVEEVRGVIVRGDTIDDTREQVHLEPVRQLSSIRTRNTVMHLVTTSCVVVGTVRTHVEAENITFCKVILQPLPLIVKVITLVDLRVQIGEGKGESSRRPRHLVDVHRDGVLQRRVPVVIDGLTGTAAFPAIVRVAHVPLISILEVECLGSSRIGRTELSIPLADPFNSMVALIRVVLIHYHVQPMIGRLILVSPDAGES